MSQLRLTFTGSSARSARSQVQGETGPTRIEQLRAAVRARVPDARVESASVLRRRYVPTGSPELDAWLGGWALPGVVEVTGRPGSGRWALLRHIVRQELRVGRSVAVVDPERSWLPVELGLEGRELGSLVGVRPPASRAGWAIEQVAASGAFRVVVAVNLPAAGRAGLRWVRAVERGGCCLFVLGEERDPSIHAGWRLRAEGWVGLLERGLGLRVRWEGRGEDARVLPWEGRA